MAFRTAYVITGDAAEAEDAAQTGFLKAYAALDRFRPGAPFRPWLLRIVANEARNRRAAASRRPATPLSALADLPLPDPAPGPEAEAVASDTRRHLIDALNHLREEDRAVLTHRYVLELSEAEMAAALGCRRGTVKSRLSRALGRLRVQLAAMEESATAAPGRTAASPAATTSTAASTAVSIASPPSRPTGSAASPSGHTASGAAVSVGEEPR